MSEWEDGIELGESGSGNLEDEEIPMNFMAGPDYGYVILVAAWQQKMMENEQKEATVRTVGKDQGLRVVEGGCHLNQERGSDRCDVFESQWRWLSGDLSLEIGERWDHQTITFEG